MPYEIAWPRKHVEWRGLLTHPARVDQGRKREVIMPSYDLAWNVAIVAASKTP